MANLQVPLSVGAFSEDVVFDVHCDGGGGTSVQGRSLGGDQGGYGGAGVGGTSEMGGTGVLGEAIGMDRDGNGGFGVLGQSEGGVGVIGEATEADQEGPAVGVEGWGPIGLRGVSTATPGDTRTTDNDYGMAGYGVVAISEAGTAIYARGKQLAASLKGDVQIAGNLTANAMTANGDASQARGRGGWVKALLYLHTPTLPPVQTTVKRYYNSQPGAQAPTVYRLDRGLYCIDFHFNVSDRYVVVTPVPGNYRGVGPADSGVSAENPFAPLWWPPASGSVGQSKFHIANAVFDGYTHMPDETDGFPENRQPNTSMITIMTFEPVLVSGGGAQVVQGFQIQDCDVSVALF